MRLVLQAASSMLCSALEEQQGCCGATLSPVINLLATQARICLNHRPPDLEGRKAPAAAGARILDALGGLERQSGQVRPF